MNNIGATGADAIGPHVPQQRERHSRDWFQLFSLAGVCRG